MSFEPSRPASSIQRFRIFPAVAIIGVGLLFLASNLGYPLDFLGRRNGWAVFILACALAPLTRAWEVYRARGRVDAEACHFLVSAAAIALVASMFLFNLDWGVWWPLFVILGGVYTLVPWRRHRCYRGPAGGASEAALKH